MVWDDYYNNGGEAQSARLTLTEARTILRHAAEGGSSRRENLKAACETLIDLTRAVVESGAYQSLKSVAFTRSRMEADLAYLVRAYEAVGQTTLRVFGNSDDETEQRFVQNFDANQRNLLKALEKWSADFMSRIGQIAPASPEDLKVYGKHSDPDLDQLVDAFQSGEEPRDYAAIGARLLGRHDQISREFDQVSHQKRQLQHEDLMKGLIGVFEGLERIRDGFRKIRRNETLSRLMKALELLLSHFESLMNKHGCYRLDLDDVEYNLNLVEIVDRRHTLQRKHKHVSKVLDHGYVYRGKPIKIARVQVATGLPGQ